MEFGSCGRGWVGNPILKGDEKMNHGPWANELHLLDPFDLQSFFDAWKKSVIKLILQKMVVNDGELSS